MNSFGLSSVNGSSSDFPVEPSPDTPSSISRSGRVRKKNSLLEGFESLDQLEGRGRKKNDKTPKTKEKSTPVPKVTLRLVSDDVDETPKRIVKKANAGKRMKFDDLTLRPNDHDFLMEDDGVDDGELEIDLPTEYDCTLPSVAAEEIIDESLLDAEDNATEIPDYASVHKLKSQAQSTYFMEKSLEKTKKGHPGMDGGIVGKVKQTRKDKGSSRITAYMLWAKDQRVNFAKKNPGMDLPQMSKKLSDLWATVPQNQKKIWKSKAAKEMKKALHMNDNIKHSGPKPLVQNAVKVKRGPKPQNRVVLTQEVLPTPPQPLIPKTPKTTPKMKKTSPEVNGHSAKIINTKMKISPKGRPKIVVTNGKPKASPSQPTATKVSPKGRPPSKLATTMPKTKGPMPLQTNRGGSNHLSQNSPPPKPERRFLSKGVAKRNGYGGPYTAAKQTAAPVPQPKTNSYPQKKEEETPVYKVTTTSPLDVAAHFSLLGESLSIIGERLRAHEGENVSGSLSVLLDSMLCALGPLACLTKQVPELNSIPDRNLTNILDDIAYIMPGL